ncbi:ribosome biogenesis protein NOP53 [Gastrophryne carolinensis]
MAAAAGGSVEGADFLGFSALSKCGEKGAPKRKRVNRNVKKNWKRHSDVRDVEEFLDDVRLQERTAGGLLAEKTDESLFFLDTGNNKKDLKVKKRKPLRIDLTLQSYSKVPVPKDVSSHQVPNGRKLKRKQERIEKLEKKGILPRSERLLRAQLIQPKTHKEEPNNKPTRGFYDLWGDNSPLDAALEGKDQWYLEQTKKSRVKRPQRLNEKPSQLPAVEVAVPGASYNPTFESHQALLLKAHELELKKLKEEEKLERQLKLPTVDEAPTEESRLRELCEGLVEESEDETAAVDESEGQSVTLRHRERKTERQRKKEKEAKVAKAKLEAEKMEKQRRQSLFQLRSIHAILKARQAELLRRKKLREQKRKLQALQPRRLGRLKYKEPDIDVMLSEELTDSLRKLKPEGSLAKDRFKSFQKRSLIEPRERAK